MGVWQSINHALLLMARDAMGWEASPSAGVVDSQSVKMTKSGGLRGFDAGKMIKGQYLDRRSGSKIFQLPNLR